MMQQKIPVGTKILPPILPFVTLEKNINDFIG